MKKFLMYVIVLVVVLFLGYTSYYFIRNNENIYLTLGEDEAIYINKGETFDLPLVWDKPYSSTNVYDNVESSDKNIVSFDAVTKKFIGNNGGIATITIAPSNTAFGPFVFNIHVGDGSVLYPYHISSSEELQEIGTESKPLSSSYLLTKDIDLTPFTDGWTPIGNGQNQFAGTFNGNGHSISNMTIKGNFENAGFFGSLSATAVIENLKISNATINGEFTNAGAIAGFSQGTIRLCEVTGLKLTNTKQNSVNGGLVGLSQNLSTNNEFNAFGYIEMSTVSVNAECNGTFGGIVGKAIGSVVFNCKSDIVKYKSEDTNAVFGGLVGVLQNANSNTYMFSVLKNSYSVLNELSYNSNAKIATVIGQNSDVGTTEFNIVKGIYYTSINTNLTAVAEGRGEAVFKSRDDLMLKATFADWDFENVWFIIDDVSMPEINFEEATSQMLSERLPGSDVTTSEDFSGVLDGLKTTPNSGKTFYITENIVLDLQNAEWTTIAKNQNQPLTSSIRCQEGKTITIKNFKLSSDNSSFFGYISGTNTIIEGIIFENVTIVNDTENVGVVATALLDNATLKDVAVNNVNIQTGENARIIGVVCAINSGKIINCNVNKDSAATDNTVTGNSTSLLIGGIAGLNLNSITDCTVTSMTFEPNTTSLDSTIFFGGINGQNSGQIKNCYNYDCIFESYPGTLYAGGVVGQNNIGATITQCYSQSVIKSAVKNNKVYVGGVVGNINGGRLIQSFYSDLVLEGGNVGGLTCINSGEIDQCYFNGSAKGERVGGLVVINEGKVTNCYTLGSLSGVSKTSNCSGLASELRVGSLVENCFSSSIFDTNKDLGTRHAETESEFRVNGFEQTVGGWFNKYPPTGDLKNCIVINYGDAHVKGSMFGSQKPGWIDCTDDQAKGLKDDYAPFKNNNFSLDIWVFDNNEGEGAYPTLKYCVQEQVIENTDDAENSESEVA